METKKIEMRLAHPKEVIGGSFEVVCLIMGIHMKYGKKRFIKSNLVYT